MLRKIASLGVLFAAIFLTASTGGVAQAKDNTTSIDIAVLGEPGPLKPTASTATLITIIGQHIYETLYAFNKNGSKISPVLASAMPKVSNKGLTYIIPLRKGVYFQNDTVMKPQDVVASIKRWLDLSPRGELAASSVQSVSVNGPSAIKIQLKSPFTALIPLLTYDTASAVIMPADIAKTRGLLKKIIGTGPYKLVEHRPDHYILMKRFAKYKPAPGKPSFHAGAHHAKIDELRFIPVPNANTRVDGVIAGQYDFADSLPPEKLPQIQRAANVTPEILRFASPYMYLNESAGVMSNRTIRKAVQAALAPKDMLLAAFGNPKFFNLDGSIYPKGSPYYDPSTSKLYNQADPKRAAALLKKAGYTGQPIRILTTQEYDYLYRMSVVAQAELQQAGFKVDLEVLDWATLLQKRANKKAWDAFFTYITFVNDPLLLPFMAPTYPGHWNTPKKQALTKAFETAPDSAARVKVWKRIQKLFYEQVPTIKIGDFSKLAAKNNRLKNYHASEWPYFWNVTLAK